MSYLSPEQSVEARSERTDVAGRQYDAAAELATAGGFTLVRHTPVHYQLWPDDKRWILNIYPSNRRLYHDPRKRGPFLRVSDDWTLLDVVMAAVEWRCGKNGG